MLTKLIVLMILSIGNIVNGMTANEIALCTQYASDKALLDAIPSPTYPVDLVETLCVTINPCTELNTRGEAVAKDTWIHRSSSNLALDNEQSAMSASSAYMYYSMEYARVPHGIVLEVCAPNFEKVRLEGVYECNPDTILSVEGKCPTPNGYGTFEVSDCQFVLETSSDLIGHIQMMRYSFLPEYGCFDSSGLDSTQTLTSPTPPNSIVSCGTLEGEGYAPGSNLCGVACKADYILDTTTNPPSCNPKCGAVTSLQCLSHEKATAVCEDMNEPRYTCEACSVQTGYETTAWSTTGTRTTTCEYDICLAGTFGDSTSVSGACTPCPVNHITTTPGHDSCTHCAPQTTGTHQQNTGQSTCVECFSETIDTSNVCETGYGLFRDYTQIQTYFANITTNTAYYDTFNNMEQFCSDSYACLPCLPGYYEDNHVCIQCAIGSYQPNFGATACFACSTGQTTTTLGCTAPEQCVCDVGYS